jgi:hypothetical protein
MQFAKSVYTKKKRHGWLCRCEANGIYFEKETPIDQTKGHAAGENDQEKIGKSPS